MNRGNTGSRGLHKGNDESPVTFNANVLCAKEIPHGNECVKTLDFALGLVGVISCNFVDRISRSVTGDPRKHTK